MSIKYNLFNNPIAMLLIRLNSIHTTGKSLWNIAVNVKHMLLHSHWNSRFYVILHFVFTRAHCGNFVFVLNLYQSAKLNSKSAKVRVTKFNSYNLHHMTTFWLLLEAACENRWSEKLYVHFTFASQRLNSRKIKSFRRRFASLTFLHVHKLIYSNDFETPVMWKCNNSWK